jgi:ankyrin repeat protein
VFDVNYEARKPNKKLSEGDPCEYRIKTKENGVEQISEWKIGTIDWSRYDLNAEELKEEEEDSFQEQQEFEVKAKDNGQVFRMVWDNMYKPRLHDVRSISTQAELDTCELKGLGNVTPLFYCPSQRYFDIKYNTKTKSISWGNRGNTKEMVTLLLGHGADMHRLLPQFIEPKSQIYTTPFLLACMYGRVDCVEPMLQHMTRDINSVYTKEKQQQYRVLRKKALIAIIECKYPFWDIYSDRGRGHREPSKFQEKYESEEWNHIVLRIVEMLLDFGKDFDWMQLTSADFEDNETDDEHGTLIHRALNSGHPEIALTLLERFSKLPRTGRNNGVDSVYMKVDVLGTEMTLLHYAADLTRHHRRRCVRNTGNHQQKAFEQICLARGATPECYRMALEKFVCKLLKLVKETHKQSAFEYYINRKVWNETALFIAAKTGNQRVFELLLENGANPKIECNSQGPVDVAAEQGHKEIFNILVHKYECVPKTGLDLSNQSGRHPYTVGQPVEYYSHYDKHKKEVWKEGVVVRVDKSSSVPYIRKEDGEFCKPKNHTYIRRTVRESTLNSAIARTNTEKPLSEALATNGCPTMI